MPITVFGSINQDLVTYTNKFPGPGETVHGESFERHLGGKGFNEAIAIAKLKSPNDKFSINLFGSIGLNDSTDFINYLSNFNVNLNFIKKFDKISTGTATIIVLNDSTAENRIIVVPGANKFSNPSIDDLNNLFNPSNNLLLTSSNDDSNINININNLSNNELSKTTPLNSSSTTFYSNKDKSSDDKLAYNQLLKNSSSIHSHSTEQIFSSKITNSYSNNELPSDLNPHASVPKLNTLTYPSPKPSSLDLQNSTIALASKAPIPNSNSNSNLNLTAQHRLTNVSFSLGGSSAHSSTTSLNPCNSYLQLLNKNRFNNNNNTNITNNNNNNANNDLTYFAILQNEIPNPYFIINHISTNFPNVKIFYNPSPLPIKKIDFNEKFLTSLHQSHYIILNEHELKGLVDNFHSNPNRDPLSNLKNISNFDIHSEFSSIVNENINNLTKLRSLLTKPAIIVTLGPAGVLFSDIGKFSYSYIPSEDVDSDEIIDTTGAGDTFFGAMVTCIYRNESLESAIKFATKASAETIKNKGSAESMPLYKDVEKRGWLL